MSFSFNCRPVRSLCDTIDISMIHHLIDIVLNLWYMRFYMRVSIKQSTVYRQRMHHERGMGNTVSPFEVNEPRPNHVPRGSMRGLSIRKRPPSPLRVESSYTNTGGKDLTFRPITIDSTHVYHTPTTRMTSTVYGSRLNTD